MVVGIDEKKVSAMKKRIRNMSAGAVAVLVAALFLSVFAPPTKVSEDVDPDALFARAAKEGSVGTAKKLGSLMPAPPWSAKWW